MYTTEKQLGENGMRKKNHIYNNSCFHWVKLQILINFFFNLNENVKKYLTCPKKRGQAESLK